MLHAIEVQVINASMNNRIDSTIEGNGGLAEPKMLLKIKNNDSNDVQGVPPFVCSEQRPQDLCVYLSHVICTECVNPVVGEIRAVKCP